MKWIIFKVLIISVLVFLFMNCTHKGSTNSKGFNKHNWGASFDAVVKDEAPNEGNSYEINGNTELVFTGTYLGVSSNPDTEDEARITYVFSENKLVGGYYYLFSNVELFNPKTLVDQIIVNEGQPTKEWTDENDSENKVWLSKGSAIRTLVQDLGDKYCFEWYVYEIEFFKQHQAELGWPE